MPTGSFARNTDTSPVPSPHRSPPRPHDRSSMRWFEASPTQGDSEAPLPSLAAQRRHQPPLPTHRASNVRGTPGLDYCSFRHRQTQVRTARGAHAHVRAVPAGNRPLRGGFADRRPGGGPGERATAGAGRSGRACGGPWVAAGLSSGKTSHPSGSRAAGTPDPGLMWAVVSRCPVVPARQAAESAAWRGRGPGLWHSLQNPVVG